MNRPDEPHFETEVSRLDGGPSARTGEAGVHGSRTPPDDAGASGNLAAGRMRRRYGS
jgi:hypothetical protein